MGSVQFQKADEPYVQLKLSQGLDEVPHKPWETGDRVGRVLRPSCTSNGAALLSKCPN